MNVEMGTFVVTDEERLAISAMMGLDGLASERTARDFLIAVAVTNLQTTLAKHRSHLATERCLAMEDALRSARIRLEHDRGLVIRCESVDCTEATLDASGKLEVSILDGLITKIDAALAPQEPAP